MDGGSKNFRLTRLGCDRYISVGIDLQQGDLLSYQDPNGFGGHWLRTGHKNEKTACHHRQHAG
jgi:hypothetical protein